MFDTDSGTNIRNRIAQANNFEDIMALVIEATSQRHGNAAARLLETPTDRSTRFEALRKLSQPDAKIAECAAARLRQLFGSPRKRPAHHASDTAVAATGAIHKERER